MDFPRYIGGTFPNSDYHHGQLKPAKGVRLFQVTRANRKYPELADDTDSTFKHAPDLAYFDQFYIQYLCTETGEYTGAGYSVLASSEDGENWNDFKVSFPTYRIPACTVTDDIGNTHIFDGTTYALMHQRMSFYRASNGCVLLLGFYGWSPDPKTPPLDHYGIGWVVRKLLSNGSLGGIYFIRHNAQAGWQSQNLLYPAYKESEDPFFVEACGELLQNNFYSRQWAEKIGGQDPLNQKEASARNEAFCWYHTNEDTVVGLWPHSKTAVSLDNGKTFSPIAVSHSLVMGEVWAEKTSDGHFAMLYNPTLETKHRYPLCVTTSDNGIDFTKMFLVHGEAPPMRYGGHTKEFGPQSVRGIAEGLPNPPDGALWVTYCVNKEDIWIARIPVPITGEEDDDIVEEFRHPDALVNWNLYSPKWSKAAWTLEDRALCLRDGEPCDYSGAQRIFRKSVRRTLSFSLTASPVEDGVLYMELQNEKGQPAIRMVFRDDHKIYLRTGSEIPIAEYTPDRSLDIQIEADCSSYRYTVSVNGIQISEEGKAEQWFQFMTAVSEICQFVLRTGSVRHTPTLDTVPEEDPAVYSPESEMPRAPSRFLIHRFTAK